MKQHMWLTTTRDAFLHLLSYLTLGIVPAPPRVPAFAMVMLNMFSARVAST